MKEVNGTINETNTPEAFRTLVVVRKKGIYIYIYICSQYNCDIDDKTIFNDQSQRLRKSIYMYIYFVSLFDN
jgi:hypothetical protein